MANVLIEKARKFIASENLMEKNCKYIIALSGGADSVCLLLCLKYLGYNIEAAHCNFKLRGKESDRDETFCKELCENKGIALHVAHFDTMSYAALHKISIEMAARTLRYNYFERLREDIGANGICVGHHMEDSVETFILNAVRGTGIKGLCGISSRNGYIIRPLLSNTRKEIDNYLKESNERYITDSSNLVNDVKRNKVRLDVIPTLREIDESADRSIWKTTRKINEAYKIFEAAIKKASEESAEIKDGYIYIDIRKLKEQASPEYTLFYILSKLSFTSATIDSIYSNLDLLKNSSIFYSATHKLIADRGYLIVDRLTTKTAKPTHIPEHGTYVINDSLKIKTSIKEYNKECQISKSNDLTTIDASKIKMPLIIRSWEKGDSFIPFGMKGKKLVSDFMTDRKFNAFQKESQLIMTDATGMIIWIVGQRVDDRVKITSKTEKILRIQLIRN